MLVLRKSEPFECDFDNTVTLTYDDNTNRIVVSSCGCREPLDEYYDDFSFSADAEDYYEELLKIVNKNKGKPIFNVTRGHCTQANNKHRTFPYSCSFPSVIEGIEASIFSVCNHSCPMCQKRRHLNKNIERRNYIWSKILKMIKGKRLKLFRVDAEGEPFISEDLLVFLENATTNDFKYFKCVSNLDIDIKRTINIFERFRREGITWHFMGSMSSCKKDLWEKIHRGGKFEDFMSNVKTLLDHNILNGLNYVKQPLNMHEGEYLKEELDKIDKRIYPITYFSPLFSDTSIEGLQLLVDIKKSIIGSSNA